MRSSLTDDKFSTLTILWIENDKTKKVNHEEAIKQFFEVIAREILPLILVILVIVIDIVLLLRSNKKL